MRAALAGMNHGFTRIDTDRIELPVRLRTASAASYRQEGRQGDRSGPWISLIGLIGLIPQDTKEAENNSDWDGCFGKNH